MARVRLPMMINSLMSSTGQNRLVLTSYFKHVPYSDGQVNHFTPIGALISNLLQLLAWEDPALRDLADYYWRAKMTGDGDGFVHLWDGSVYSTGLTQI